MNTDKPEMQHVDVHVDDNLLERDTLKQLYLISALLESVVEAARKRNADDKEWVIEESEIVTRGLQSYLQQLQNIKKQYLPPFQIIKHLERYRIVVDANLSENMTKH